MSPIYFLGLKVMLGNRVLIDKTSIEMRPFLSNDWLKNFPIRGKRNQIFQIHCQQGQMMDFEDECFQSDSHNAHAKLDFFDAKSKMSEPYLEGKS